MTVRSKHVKQCTEEDVRWEGKSSVGTGKGEKEEVNGKSIYLDGQHVSEVLNMFAYERYCMTMCTCIVQTVNLLAEYEEIDQFMLGREDKQGKQHYYITFSQKLD